MSCVRCEQSPFGSPIPKFDVVSEGAYLSRLFSLTGSLSVVAETAAREVITYQAEWGANKPEQPILFFRYEKGPNGWSWAGEHFLSYFDPNQPGADRKDRYESAEKGMPSGGQAIVFSEDLGEGFRKSYIHIYTDFGDHVEGRAYEYRGSEESFARTKLILEGRENKNLEAIDFSQPIFLSNQIEPQDFLKAIVKGYDEFDKTSNKEYVERMTRAVDQIPLLESQFETQVTALARQAEEQFVQSEVGVKLFSDVAQTMVHSLEQEQRNQEHQVKQDSFVGKAIIGQPVAHITETVVGAASFAVRDTAKSVTAVGAMMLEHIRRKKVKQEDRRTEEKAKSQSTLNFSPDMFQFAQRFSMAEPQRKPIISGKSKEVVKNIKGKIEKMVLHTQQIVKTREKKIVRADIKLRREKKRSKLIRAEAIKRTEKTKRKKQSVKEFIRRAKKNEMPISVKRKKLLFDRFLRIESSEKKKISRKKDMWRALVKLAKRIQREKVFLFGTEKKKRKVVEEQLVVRFSFAWLLWMITSKNFHLSIDRSVKKKKERAVKKEPTRWVLLAIIWHLNAIREHGKPVVYKKQKKKQTKPLVFPKQAVIFALAS